MQQSLFNDIVNKLSTKNQNMQQRRTINAADAVDTQDYVTLNDLQTRLTPSAYSDTTQAQNIISGVLAPKRLPTPTPTSLGGIKSIAKVVTKFIQWIDNSGNPILAQPAFTDISGVLTPGQIPASVKPVTNQVVGGRALGVVYQNTHASPLFVNVTGSLDIGGQVYFQNDSSNPPGTVIGTIYSPTVAMIGSFFFIVLPNNYYFAGIGSGHPTLDAWVEWF